MHVIIELKHRALSQADRDRIGRAIQQYGEIPTATHFVDAGLDAVRAAGEYWCEFQIRDGFGVLVLANSVPTNTVLHIGMYSSADSRTEMLATAEDALSAVKKAFTTGQLVSLNKPSMDKKYPAKIRVGVSELPFAGRENKLRDELKARFVTGNFGPMASAAVAIGSLSFIVTDEAQAGLLIPFVGVTTQSLTHLLVAFIHRKDILWSPM